MKSPIKTFALATASLGLAVTAVPAMAGADGVQTQKISTAGLDLSTAEGQRMLDQRIERAARDVCNYDEPRTGSKIRSHQTVECLAKARASAQSQVASIMTEQQLGG